MNIKCKNLLDIATNMQILIKFGVFFSNTKYQENNKEINVNYDFVSSASWLVE